MNMGNVLFIDLWNGSFVSLLENTTSTYFLSVKFMNLNQQGLKTLSPCFINAPNLTYANFSSNVVESVQDKAFLCMQNVHTLSLAVNKLKALELYFCRDLAFLSHLYQTDNPLINIAADVFLENPGLIMIRSDWYMVCCVAIGVKDCQPQNQFVSSCSNLISSAGPKVVIMMQGIFVVLSNIGALVLQIVFPNMHSAVAEKYLIVSLNLADLLMGCYLLVIGIVDLTSQDVFYKIVSEWTNDPLCLALGLISFISSEVSLLILCVLSCARMIGIQKVGGMKFMKTKVKLACIFSWVIITISGLAYVVYLLIQNMKVRNNMCILQGISEQRYITQMERMFQMVTLTFNAFCVFVLMISMVCIFIIVSKSSRSVAKVGGQQGKSKDRRLIKLGLRLLLLLICSVITWLPFIIVSFLLLTGITVHENVLQWVAVLCLPICASTDPVLYSLVSLMRNRKKK